MFVSQHITLLYESVYMQPPDTINTHRLILFVEQKVDFLIFYKF